MNTVPPSFLLRMGTLDIYRSTKGELALGTQEHFHISNRKATNTKVLGTESLAQVSPDYAEGKFGFKTSTVLDREVYY